MRGWLRLGNGESFPQAGLSVNARTPRRHSGERKRRGISSVEDLPGRARRLGLLVW